MNYKFRTTTNNSNSDKSVVKLLCTPQEAETWKHSAERLGMSRNQYLRHLISANEPGLPVRPSSEKSWTAHNIHYLEGSSSLGLSCLRASKIPAPLLLGPRLQRAFHESQCHRLWRLSFACIHFGGHLGNTLLHKASSGRSCSCPIEANQSLIVPWKTTTSAIYAQSPILGVYSFEQLVVLSFY